MANANPPPSGLNLTPTQVTDALWNYHFRNFRNGSIREIVVHLGWKNHLGQTGINELAKRLRLVFASCMFDMRLTMPFDSLLLETPVTTIENVQVSRLIISPVSSTEGHTMEVFQTQSAASGGKGQKVARPPNAFILYRKHFHKIFKYADPNMHNNEISKKVGEAWNTATESTKDHFRKLAEAAKAKHMEEHPDYVYQPRKPHEKKKRMTRRKREAFAKATADVDDLSLPKNHYGNVIFELGPDNDIEDLEARLHEYNRNLAAPPSHRDKFINQIMPAAIHSERTQEWQNDFNFYDGTVGAYPFAYPESSALIGYQHPSSAEPFTERTVALQDVEMDRMYRGL